MPRASRLLQLRAWGAATQRAWASGAPALAPLSAAPPSLLGGARGGGARDALAAGAAFPSAAAATTLATTSAAAPSSSSLLPSFAHASSFSSVSEAAARARRLAAAQARRQQQHDRAAARLARAAAAPPPAAADENQPDQNALAPSSPRHEGPLADVDPGSLRPADAAAVARAVSHPALVVTRAVEWGTVVFGFEQANKYTVYDQEGQIVCLIAEDETGLTNALGRQLLRTRRAFTATVLSPDDGSVLFRVRRPAYLVSSTTFVETEDGTPVGEVRQRWHPLRRNFDLYVEQRQYARISGPLLAWEFVLTDDAGKTLALIDRNFQGFARELFTDAGKYVVHFGHDAEDSAAMAQKTLEARTGGKRDFPPVRPLAIGGSGGAAGAAAGPGAGQEGSSSNAVAVIPQVTGGQLAVARPLALDERMVALAAAIAIDFAFFSQHSHTSGMFAPPLIFPMPFPGGGGGGGAAEEAGAGDGAAPTGGGAEGGTAAGGAVGGGGAGLGGDGGFGGAGAGSSSSSPPQQQDGDGWGWAGGGGGEGGAAGDGGGDSGWTDGWGGGGDDAGDDGEGGGTVGSVVRGLWRVFGDDD